MPTLSQSISEFVCSTDYPDIPPRALEKAKWNILDCVGVTLAGVTDRNGRIIIDYLRESGGKGESAIFGLADRVPAANAALANGVAGHALDYDDSCLVMIGHPSVVTCAPSFAVGELVGASGKEILAAFVLGGEVACRLGAALTEKQYEAGWHNTGTVGTFGATVAAGKLLRLNQDQMAYAIGIAASMAAGIKKNFGTSCKPYHAGQACSNGVKAAILAKKGFNSALDIIEGKPGFASLFSGTLKSEHLTERIGKPFVIDEPGYTPKLYPSCAASHSAIDATLELRKKYGIDPDEVERIDCSTAGIALSTMIYKIPTSGLEGKFSIPFCLSVALIDGQALLEQFADERCQDPKVVNMMKKVVFHLNDEINSRSYTDPAAIVTVRLKDGREVAKAIERPKGDPANPLSDRELLDKYEICSSYSIKGEKVKLSAETILSLEKVQEPRQIIEKLIP